MTTTTLTNTGLDQLTNIILSDTGLAGNKRVLATDIQTGATSANGMNALIIEAIKATSTANDGKFTAADIRDISDYIKKHYATEWTALHGDDETGVETGFHLVQNDGATTTLYDKNAVNTVADSIYHLGFGYKNNNLINEDGNNNANLTTVATWLNSLLATDLTTTSLASQTIDLSTTGTGLDQLTDLIIADEGLNQRISTTEIRAGATAANGMNALIIEAIKATGVANDATLTGADVRDINAYLRANHLTTWTALHGNDEDNQPETGFHLVQNDGATTKLYDKNAVNTVADGIYHLAFEVKNNNLLNEDGNANANVNTVATWLTSLLATDLAAGSLSSGTTTDLSTTGTGLDQLTDLIMVDAGLNSKISTTEIKAGATAANSMNKLIIEGIKAMGVANDGTISTVDVREVNSYLRVNHAAEWLVLHGDDEDGVETGFHLVQNDGATTKLYDKNAVNTVADGIYHLGFTIDSNRLLNEDGNKNAAVSDVATWLNSLLATDIANGSLNGTTLVGQSAIVTTVAIA